MPVSFEASKQECGTARRGAARRAFQKGCEGTIVGTDAVSSQLVLQHSLIFSLFAWLGYQDIRRGKLERCVRQLGKSDP